MNDYQEKLKRKMNEYVHFIYRITKKFPKSELFGSVSQMRRAAMSVILNYIEGYARRKILVRLNLLETSYGSLQESKYLLHFSLVEKYINRDEYNTGFKLAEEISAMLWKEIDNLDRSIDNQKTKKQDNKKVK